MNKNGMITALSKRLGTDRGVTNIFVNAVLDEIGLRLEKGEDIRFVNFGQFEVVAQPETKRRDPRTGEPITVPPTNKVRFRAARQLKNRVSGRYPEHGKVRNANVIIEF